MSSMLEQAIVDAKSLREAAIRNAEETLVEKYSDDIKEAVEKLLEQDPVDDQLMPMEPVGPQPVEGPPEEGGEMPMQPDAPMAALDGEDMCPCPEDGVEVELDLTAIKDELQAMEAEEMGEPMPHEELGMALAEGKEDEVLELLEEDDEEFDLSEEELKELLEKVVVDMAPVGASWAGRPVAEREFEEDKHKAVLAQEHDIDVLTQENKKLEGQILQLQESIKVFKQREHKYNEIVETLKENF